MAQTRSWVSSGSSPRVEAVFVPKCGPSGGLRKTRPHLASLACYIRNVAKPDFCKQASFGRSIRDGQRVFGAVVLALLSASPAWADATDGNAAQPAASQPSDAEMAAAKQHFDTGAQFFKAENYAAARAEFQAAYDLSKLTPLLYNLGRAAEGQGQKADALRYYEQYLATNPSDAAEVRTRVATLKTDTASQTTAPTPLDGGPAWLKGTAKLPPIPAIAALGAGVAFVAIGIGTGVAAKSIEAEVGTPSNRYWTGDAAALYDKGKALNGTAIAFGVLGGVALAGGAAWTGYWFYLRGKQPSATTPTTAPTARIIPTGNGLAVVGGF